MIPSPGGRYDRLSASEIARIDAVCDRFEKAWKAVAGGAARPSVADLARDLPEPARSALVWELIALDRDYRAARGETPNDADYRGLCAEYDAALEAAGATPTLGPTVGDARATGPLDDVWPQLPGLKVTASLGAGGMGVVYKAWQPELERHVAVKMLRGADVASPESRERFRREARALAQLRHPNLVQVYAVGEIGALGGTQPLPYLVLEYANAGSLAQRLAGKPQPPRVAARFVADLASAMAQVHQRGIVHRDVKPSNVLLHRETPTDASDALDAPGLVPKLSDFGLARFGGSDLTRTGDALGTPSYMAPEQAGDTLVPTTEATDTYGLGAVLYEMLAGRPPFRAETALATVLQVRTEDPVSPRSLQPTIPPDLDTICLKCLRKDPRARYASAAELADDLRRFVEGKPIRARPTSALERAARWARRRPLVAGLSALVVAVTLGGVIGIFTQWRRAEGLLGEVTTARDDEKTQRGIAVQLAKQASDLAEARAAALADARTNLYYYRIFRAGHDVNEGAFDTARQALDECEPQLRHIEWGLLDRMARFAPAPTPPLAKGVQRDMTLVAPDGASLLTLEREPAGSRVVAWDAKPLKERWRWSSAARAATASFGDAGKRVAVVVPGAKTSVVVLDSATGQPLRAFDVGASNVADRFVVDPSSDAFPKRLAICRSDGVAHVWNLPASTSTRWTSAVKATPWLAFGPDGLAAIAHDHEVTVWDVDAGRAVGPSATLLGRATAVAYSVARKQVAVGTSRGEVCLYTVAPRESPPLKLSRTDAAHRDAVAGLAFREKPTPNAMLASHCPTGSMALHYPTARFEPRRLAKAGGLPSHVQFLDDGRVFRSTAGVDGSGRAWNADDAPPRLAHDPFRFLLNPKKSTTFDFSDLGVTTKGVRRLAVDRTGAKFVAIDSQFATVWSLPDGNRLSRWPTDAIHGSLETSPSGELLATSRATSDVVEVRRAFDGVPIATLGGHKGSAEVVRFLDEDRLLTVDRGVRWRIWSVRESQVLAQGPAPKGSTPYPAVSRRAERIAWAVDDELVVWNVADGREERRFACPGFRTRFSDTFVDRDRLAFCTQSRGEIRLEIWDLGAGRPSTAPASLSSFDRHLVASADGQRLFAATALGSVRIVETQTARELLVLPRQGAVITSLAVGPDDRTLLVGGVDHSVHIWRGE